MIDELFMEDGNGVGSLRTVDPGLSSSDSVLDSLKDIVGIEGESDPTHEKRDFKDLLRRPPAGSLLKRFLSCKKKEDLERVLAKFLKEDLLATYFNPDVILLPYVLFRFVLPHSSAISLAEHFRVALPKDPTDSVVLERLSKVIGEKLEDRGDIKKIFMKMQSYHPQLTGMLQSIIGTTISRKIV